MPIFIFSVCCFLSLSVFANETWTNSIGMTFVKVGGSIIAKNGDSIEAKRRCNPLFFEKCGSGGNSNYPGDIPHPLWIGTTEVTQAQWKSVMGDNPSHFKGDKLPVESVSYHDVEKFIVKLNQFDRKKQYRLPTEWEWEYAARGGVTTDFTTGRCISSDTEANYNGNYPPDNCPKGVYRKKTTAVASFPANRFGLYDVQGNVWEWTCTDYAKPYANQCNNHATRRVLRGGSWLFNGDSVRLGTRINYKPTFLSNNIGFRLVLSGFARK